MSGILTVHPHLLSLEVQPDREWDTNNNGQPREQRVTTTVPKGSEHLFSEQGERESKERSEDGSGGEGTGGVLEGVDEVKLDWKAAWWEA